jgi:co-chaperonin GroES (HSP10)
MSEKENGLDKFEVGSRTVSYHKVNEQEIMPSLEFCKNEVEPLFDLVMIEKVPNESREKIGSLYIPETSKEIPAHEGKVIAIGSGCTKVNVGDFVWWGKHAGTILRPKNTTGDNVYIMAENDILARRKAVS